jgi:hypothetical protein
MTGALILPDKFLDDIAKNIRALEHKGRRDVFKIGYEIGEQLAKAQEHLSRQRSGGGGWLEWLAQAFPDWHQRTSYRYIGLFKFVQRHGGEFDTWQTQIDLTAVYLLDAPSTPSEVVPPVLERAASGEKITGAKVKAAIAEAVLPANPGMSGRQDTRGRRQPAHRLRPSAPPSDAPAPAPPAPGKFIGGETLADVTWAIAALVRSIADVEPAEVVAESDPAALVRLAGDAGLASAWLAALEVLAASAAKRAPNHPAGNGGAPLPQLDLSPNGSCK